MRSTQSSSNGAAALGASCTQHDGGLNSVQSPCCVAFRGQDSRLTGGGRGGVTGGMDGGDDYYYHCTRIDGGARFEEASTARSQQRQRSAGSGVRYRVDRGLHWV